MGLYSRPLALRSFEERGGAQLVVMEAHPPALVRVKILGVGEGMDEAVPGVPAPPSCRKMYARGVRALGSCDCLMLVRSICTGGGSGDNRDDDGEVGKHSKLSRKTLGDGLLPLRPVDIGSSLCGSSSCQAPRNGRAGLSRSL